jgi:CheY-like chemotaxis protein
MVAEDAPEVARRVGALIEELGAAELVGSVASGEEALRLFEAARPDGVVLDVHMPGKSGIEVLRTIRASGRRCLVVVMSSVAEPSIREACLSSGADYFFLKASGYDALIEALEVEAARRREEGP